MNKNDAPYAKKIFFIRGIIHLCLIIGISSSAFSFDITLAFKIVLGIAIFAILVFIWALFLSPQKVIRSELFLESFVELTLLALFIFSLNLLSVSSVVLIIIFLLAGCALFTLRLFDARFKAKP